MPEPVIRTADIVVMMEPDELDCLVLPRRVAPGLLELAKAPGAVASASGHRIQSLKNASASREDGYWRIDMFVDGFSTGPASCRIRYFQLRRPWRGKFALVAALCRSHAIEKH